jgi:uncharacterized protein
MNCPVCNVPLQMTERQGVEIDYCNQCRGVWLDRGELDKIIERAQQPYPPAPPIQAQPPRSDYGSVGGGFPGGVPGGAPPQYGRDEPTRGYDRDYRRDYYDRDDDDDYYRDSQGKRKRKKGSFLGDLFDFD